MYIQLDIIRYMNIYPNIISRNNVHITIYHRRTFLLITCIIFNNTEYINIAFPVKIPNLLRGLGEGGEGS